MLGEPERLGKSEREKALEADVTREDPLEQRPAPQRLARHPNRLAGRTAKHVLAVVPHRVEVDERKGRLDAGKRPLQTLVIVARHCRLPVAGLEGVARRHRQASLPGPGKAHA